MEDFRDSLQEFLEAMILRQKKASDFVFSHQVPELIVECKLQLIKTWENYQEMLLSKAGANTTPRGQQQQSLQADGQPVEA